MSFTNITPIVHSHLLYGQAGRDILLMDHTGVVGDSGGSAGIGPTDYKEYLAGDQCGNFTSADNTSGTLYFPEIKYWTALHNISINLSDLLELETMAKSVTGDHLSKTGDYDPEDTMSAFFIYIMEMRFLESLTEYVYIKQDLQVKRKTVINKRAIK